MPTTCRGNSGGSLQTADLVLDLSELLYTLDGEFGEIRVLVATGVGLRDIGAGRAGEADASSLSAPKELGARSQGVGERPAADSVGEVLGEDAACDVVGVEVADRSEGSRPE